MRRIYSIAVATAILSAVGLSGAWFLSGPSAGANNSPGSSGINIEADSPSSSPGTVLSESGNSSPQQQEKVKDAGIAATQPAKTNASKQDADKYSRIPDGESVKGSFRKGQADSLAVAAAQSLSQEVHCCATPSCRCRCLPRMICPNLISP